MSKTDILKENGTFNTNNSNVTADEFQHGIFFDPNDLLQVKYEMLRSVEKNGLSISDASKMYGLSRQTYYICKEAFDKGGLSALLPKKTGPRKSHKLTGDGQLFIDHYLVEHPCAKPHEINQAMHESTGIIVHDRTVDRYLSKKRQGSR